MATRDVQFNFAVSPLPPSPTVAATDHMVLQVNDQTNTAVYTSPNLAPSSTTLTISLPTQQSFTAYLKSYAADGTPNPSASSGNPHQGFTVNDPPPPVPPGDPTLASPVLL